MVWVFLNSLILEGVTGKMRVSVQLKNRKKQEVVLGIGNDDVRALIDGEEIMIDDPQLLKTLGIQSFTIKSEKAWLQDQKEYEHEKEQERLASARTGN